MCVLYMLLSDPEVLIINTNIFIYTINFFFIYFFYSLLLSRDIRSAIPKISILPIRSFLILKKSCVTRQFWVNIVNSCNFEAQLLHGNVTYQQNEIVIL